MGEIAFPGKQRICALDLRSKCGAKCGAKCGRLARVRSELGERYHSTLLEVTLAVVLLVLVAGRAAPVRRQARPYPRATDHPRVSLPVLLVHDHVNYWIHAGREVQ